MPGHGTQDSLDMKLRYEVILNTLCDSFNNNIHHTQESYIDLYIYGRTSPYLYRSAFAVFVFAFL